MIKLRKQTYFLQTKHFYTGTVSEKHTRGLNDITWHGIELNKPEWHNPFSKTLAFTIAGVCGEMVSDFSGRGEREKFKDEDIHVMMNMHHEPLTFQIPQIFNRSWFIYTDTFENYTSEDIFYPEDTYLVKPRSIVVLVSKQLI
jgi:Type II secretory pathway, pullulanase PulA and related glycosidases